MSILLMFSRLNLVSSQRKCLKFSSYLMTSSPLPSTDPKAFPLGWKGLASFHCLHQRHQMQRKKNPWTLFSLPWARIIRPYPGGHNSFYSIPSITPLLLFRESPLNSSFPVSPFGTSLYWNFMLCANIMKSDLYKSPKKKKKKGKIFKRVGPENSLAFQQLGLQAVTAGGPGFNPWLRN